MALNTYPWLLVGAGILTAAGVTILALRVHDFVASVRHIVEHVRHRPHSTTAPR